MILHTQRLIDNEVINLELECTRAYWDRDSLEIDVLEATDEDRKPVAVSNVVLTWTEAEKVWEELDA